MIEIVERHMVGGTLHEHIAEVKYKSGSEIKRATREGVVKWLDASDTNIAIVRSQSDPTQTVRVGVVHRDNAPDYIRTYANKQWTDNLLSLKEY